MATIQEFQGQRLTYRTTTAFDTVIDRLRRQLNPQGLPISEGPKMEASTHIAPSRESFEQFWKDRTGSSSFLYFYEIDYGKWLPLFGIGGGHKAGRFILGNPLIAVTMIKHDLNACLSVPVELLVREADGGFVEVIYNLPSSLILNDQNNSNGELREAVVFLDGKLADLAKTITGV